MGSDRITVIRGRENGALDWYVYRRGQPAVLQHGTLASTSEPVPAEIRGKSAGALTLALPASQVVVRIMKLPLLDPEELAGAVELQVDKFSPFPVEQMVYSYEVLAQQEDETSVLIAISQRASVTNWGDAIRQTGTRIDRVDCVALGAWHTLQASGTLAVERRESFLLIDSDAVVLFVHDRGQLVQVSGLGQPGAFTDAAVCDDLAEEVARILMEIDAEIGVGVDARLLVAALDETMPLDGLRTALEGTVDIPVGPFQGKSFPDATAGVMLRSCSAETEAPLLNLIPPEWVRDADSQRFRKQMVAAGCAVLGVWFLLLGGGWGFMAWQHSRLTYLRKAQQQWREPADAVRSLRLQVKLIDQYRDRSQSALECLREISSIQPQGVDLTSFTYRKGGGIELVGEAERGPLVLQFNQALNDSELFDDVRPGARTQTQQGRHRFSFEIIFGEVAP